MESLQKIGDAIITPDGNVRMDPLKLRLSEAYLKALDDVYGETKIVILPQPIRDELQSQNPMNSASVATALELYKQVLGPDGVTPPESKI